MKNDAGYLAVDPVCGMKVNPAEAAASLEFQGKSYHFCSTGCHRKFSENPAAFLQSPEGDAGEHAARHGQAVTTAAATT